MYNDSSLTRLLYTLRGFLALFAMIFIIYLSTNLNNGSFVYGKIQGRWISIDGSSEYIFQDKEFTCRHDKYPNGIYSGDYYIRGDKIYLSSGEEYHITVGGNRLIISGIFYYKD